MRPLKRLTVTSGSLPGTYTVLIGKTKVGWVRKRDRDTRTSATSFTFLPELDAFPSKREVPAIFITGTMREIRQELSSRISADTYHKILENEPGED